MDIMIHPAISMEIYGLNIAETLALGIPVIATRCGGAEMQVRDGKNGYLVEPNDVEALKDTILKFMRNPKALTVAPGDVFSIEIHVEQLIKTYEALIN
jgi:glycosyltransferase involved in cell wall biosynthesis